MAVLRRFGVPRRWSLGVGLWLLAAMAPTLALAERIALVVGNARYEHLPSLATPAEDTRAVAEALRRLGFEVTLLSDVSTEMFDVVLEAFAKDAKDAEAVLFWYAGHAFQEAGANRLVPVAARLDRAEALAAETWSMDEIAARIAGPATTLIFLDACRTSPVPEALRPAGAASQGLAEFETAAGSFVAFSTRPGAVSYDLGGGRHSPFAQAFLDRVERPGQSVSDLMIEVRNAVEVATVGRQVPWDQSSLRAQFYFAGQDAALAPEAGGDVVAADDDDAALLALMQDVVIDNTVVLGPAPAPAAAGPAAASAVAAASPVAADPVAADPVPAVPVAVPPGPLRLAAAATVRPAIQAIAGGRAPAAGGTTALTRAAPQPRLAPVPAAEAAPRVPGRALPGQDPSAAEAGSSLTPASAPGPAAPAPEDLPRALQEELGRVGCYRLGVDGDWGQGSRSAVRRYLEAKKAPVTDAALEPTADLWQALRAETGEVCTAPVAAPVAAKKAPQKAKPAAKAPAKKEAVAKAPAKKQPAAKKPAAPAPAKKQVKCTFMVVAIVCK